VCAALKAPLFELRSIVKSKVSDLMSANQSKKLLIPSIVFLAPALLIIIVFFVFPVLQSFYYSFTNFNGLSPNYSFVGFDNFRNVLTTRQSTAVIWNTFYLMLIYIPVLNVLALALAVLIKDSGKRLQNLFKSVFFFPNLLALAVVGYIWRMMLNPATGAFNQFLKSIGLDSLAIDWLGRADTVLPVVSLTTIWFATGFYMVIYLAGLMGIPTELYEASSIDGASRWQQFRFITIPQLAPSFTINLILTTIGILGAFDLPFIMTEGGPGFQSTTIALQIYFFNSRQMNLANGVALSVLLCIISLIITAVLFLVTSRREEKMR